MIVDSSLVRLKSLYKKQLPYKKDTNLTDLDVSVTPESLQKQFVKKETKQRKVKEDDWKARKKKDYKEACRVSSEIRDQKDFYWKSEARSHCR